MVKYKRKIKWIRIFGLSVLSAVCFLWAGSEIADAADRDAVPGTEPGRQTEEISEPVIAGQHKVIYMDSRDEISIVGKDIQSVEYSSSNRGVANVSKEGVVSGENEGKTTIKARVTYGDVKNPAVKELSYEVQVIDNFTNYFEIKNGRIEGLTDKGKSIKEMYLPDYCDFIRVKDADWGKILGGNQVVEKLFLSDYIEVYRCRFTQSDVPQHLNEISLGKRMYAFYSENRYTSLETFSLHPENKEFELRDGVLFCGKTLLYYPIGKEENVYHMPEDIMHIWPYAFCGITNLDTIVFPDTLESIGENAFKNSSLTEVKLPFKVSMREGAFSNCAKLESVVLPSRYMMSDRGVFKNCPVLKTAIVPNTATDFCANLFESCPELQEYQVTAGVSDYQVEDGVLFQKSTQTLTAYPMGKRDTAYTVPSGIKCIDEYSFGGARYLSSIKLCDSLTNIRTDAFKDCRALKKIHIPRRVESIGVVEWGMESWGMFRGCDSLAEITVDSMNKYYSSKKGVLYDKAKNKLYRYPQNKRGAKFTVPRTVSILSTAAFAEAKYLQKIDLGKTKKIHRQAFAYAGALKTVSLPATVNSIGIGIFDGCKSLAKAVIPDKVQYIESRLFADCTSLKEVVMGKSVKRIYDQSFYRCKSLQKITFRGKKWLSAYKKPKYRKESKSPFYQAGSKHYSKLKAYVPKCTKTQKSKAKKGLRNLGLNEKAKIIFAAK